MNKFFKNTTAILLAGIMGAASLGTVASAYDGITAESFSVDYLAGVSKPTYSVKGAKGYRYIKLSCSTSKAKIYYTTDGSTPSKTNGKKYSGGLIKITKNTKFKAIAYKGTTKSSVMTKTFYVATKPGDVTGDGVINSTDYKRLKSYLNGKTTYICKDNADTSGNGGVSSKDLTLLKDYLDGDITKFPAQGGGVTAPSITVYKALGGKEFKLTAPKGTIYYTTNGSTPTTKSKKYTGSRVLVSKDTTVKYVTYYSGKYSSVKSKDIEVDTCAQVVTKTDQNREYDDSVTVTLSCATSGATIYYTTDGTDPRTSSTYRVYNSYGIKVTKDTVIRAYARCKGYADSSASSFSYKVRSQSFSVSGYVWADTTVDGKRTSGESGVSGVGVSLIDSSGYTVSTANTDSYGYYSIGGAKKGKSYKVMFTYNGQKYRAYDYIITGGNQAIESASTTALTISNSGAVSSGNKTISSANNYSKAITDSTYNMTATTSSSYSGDTQNVNLALKTDNYGSMKLGFTLPSNNSTASAGSNVDYSLTLSNTGNKTINSAIVRIYVNSNTMLSGVYTSNGTSVTTSSASASGSYYYYDVTFTNIAPNSSATYTVKTTVSSQITTETKIKHCAQVMSYSYSGSCYDKNITPGAMTIGTASQVSEAVTPEVTVGKPAVQETLDILDNTSVTMESNSSISIRALVGNAAKFDNSIITVSSSAPNVAKAYVGSVSQISAGANVNIDIYSQAVEADTPVTVTVALASDPSKPKTISIIVKKKPDTTEQGGNEGGNTEGDNTQGGTTV